MEKKRLTGYQDIPLFGVSLSREKRYEAMVWPMLGWYDIHARTLPWREQVSAYRVWISEIMLQQTRVEAVKPYYARFLAELPDVKALAEVPEERLMKLWQGLGYYSRARNLQKAANVVMEQFGGEMPKTHEELLSLPGIGSYTAGAIASIAYGLPEPALDGNGFRVLTRLFEDDREIDKPQLRKELEAELRTLLVQGAEGREIPAGKFNQAMMEIGATVCVPNGAPLCEECPLSGICLAHHTGTETDYPVKSAKKPRKIENRTIFRIETPTGYLIRKRPEKGLLAGLYEFPAAEERLDETSAARYVQDAVQNACNESTSGDELESDTGADAAASAIEMESIGDAKHIFSHIEWHMTGYRVQIKKETAERLKAYWNLVEVTGEEFQEDVAMPSAFRAYVPQ